MSDTFYTPPAVLAALGLPAYEPAAGTGSFLSNPPFSMSNTTTQDPTAMVAVPIAALKRIKIALEVGLRLATDDLKTAEVAFGGNHSLELHFYAEQLEQMRQAFETVAAELEVVK